MSADPRLVRVDGTQLTCDEVHSVAMGGAPVAVAPAGLDRARAAAEVVREVAGAGPVYGRTTGVGANRSAEAVGDAHGLQLLRSHAGGSGPLLDEARTRAMMLVRLNQLAAGGSGVDPALLAALADALNEQAIPPVYRYGAIGTADLTALATMALCLLGERPWRSGELPPIAFDPADALAFISSNAATVGEAALAFCDIRRLLDAALAIAALSFLAVDGSAEPYELAVHTSRHHRGQRLVAARMRELLAPESDRPAARIQDPYSYRALPQVHGPAVDAAATLEGILAVEMNAAAENPLVDVAGRRVLHNGNFHTSYVAHALDAARVAMFSTAALSAARLGSLNEPGYTGLRPFLAAGSPTSSGVMILEYIAHSALADMRQSGMSAAMGTAVLSRGVEEHASFSAQAARGTTDALAAYQVVLACELVAAVRALRLKERMPRPGPLRWAYERAAAVLDPATEDRPLDDDVRAATNVLAELVRPGPRPQGRPAARVRAGRPSSARK